jgi:ribokinase
VTEPPAPTTATDPSMASGAAKTIGVLVVGDLATDIVAIHSGELAADSDTAARIRTAGGGAGANIAAWLVAAGVAVRLVAVVGTDPIGTQRLAELAASGVDTTAVRRTERAGTGWVIVLVRGAQRSMLSDRGANLQLQESDVDNALAARPAPAHLHLSGYALLDPGPRPAGRHALAAAHATGLTTSVDAASAAPLRAVGGPRFLDWVRDADLLFATEAEARVLLDAGSAETAASLATGLAGHAGVAVVKSGRRGAVCATAGGEVLRVDGVATTAVDPTGAGDAFAAGFLVRWLADPNPAHQVLAAALHRAAQLGAAAVSRLGARPAPPRR